MLKKDNPGFVQCPCKGPLAKFRSRGVYAIDSSTIRLAYNAFAKLYSHHQRGGFFVVREGDADTPLWLVRWHRKRLELPPKRRVILDALAVD